LIIGETFKHPGQTRWWATYELYVRLLRDFKKVLSFLKNAISEGGLTDDGARIRRLIQLINDRESCARLHLELSVVVAVAKPLVEATYLLEGNGPLALIAYDQVIRVKSYFELHKDRATWPGISAALADYTAEMAAIEGDDANENNIRHLTVLFVQQIMAPVEEYFLSRIFDHLGGDVAIYKVLRNANPIAVRRSPPTVNEFAADVESLDHFLPDDIAKMIRELPKYINTAQNWAPPADIADELDSIVSFWRNNGSQMPALSRFVYAFTIITSSAAAERVFSVIKRSFDTCQKGALEDYVFLSTIMQYNKVKGVQDLRII
jgi:hAT family C-terminal dimerisation region